MQGEGKVGAVNQPPILSYGDEWRSLGACWNRGCDRLDIPLLVDNSGFRGSGTKGRDDSKFCRETRDVSLEHVQSRFFRHCCDFVLLPRIEYVVVAL